MLVENKFIYLSLPRCASTSFYITCLKKNLNTIHYEEAGFSKRNTKLDLTLDNEMIADKIIHAHEKITDLREKFGYQYEIVSIKRNRYERFISLWKHVIDLANDNYPSNFTNVLKSLKIENIFFYKKEDLLSEASKANLLNKFFKDNGLREYQDSYMMTMIYILINPTSHFHNNDPHIIWFDFDKINEFEKWVSNKLEIDFVLEKSNGSQHFDCNVKLDDNFINLYDSIYDYYDLPKQIKTLL